MLEPSYEGDGRIAITRPEPGEQRLIREVPLSEALSAVVAITA
jgi:hypothetical protein